MRSNFLLSLDKAQKVLDTVLVSDARDPNNYCRFLAVLEKSSQLSGDVAFSDVVVKIDGKDPETSVRKVSFPGAKAFCRFTSLVVGMDMALRLSRYI